MSRQSGSQINLPRQCYLRPIAKECRILRIEVNCFCVKVHGFQPLMICNRFITLLLEHKRVLRRRHTSLLIYVARRANDGDAKLMHSRKSENESSPCLLNFEYRYGNQARPERERPPQIRVPKSSFTIWEMSLLGTPADRSFRNR